MQQEVTSVAPKSPPVVFNITANSIKHGMEGNDDDLISLARIQGELPPAVSPRRPSSRTDVHPLDEPQSLNDSIKSNTSYASLVRNGQLNTNHAHDRKNFRHITNRRNRNKNNIGQRNGHFKREEEIVTGSGNNFNICASDHQRRRFEPKYRGCTGVFVSRLQRDTTRYNASCRCGTSRVSCVWFTSKM